MSVCTDIPSQGTRALYITSSFGSGEKKRGTIMIQKQEWKNG